MTPAPGIPIITANEGGCSMSAACNRNMRRTVSRRSITSWIRRIRIVVLALVLCISPLRPARAFFSELIVGGGIALEVAEALIGALPQISLLVTSLVALAKSSDELADAVVGLLHPSDSESRDGRGGEKVGEERKQSADCAGERAGREGTSSETASHRDETTGERISEEVLERLRKSLGEVEVSYPARRDGGSSAGSESDESMERYALASAELCGTMLEALAGDEEELRSLVVFLEELRRRLDTEERLRRAVGPALEIVSRRRLRTLHENAAIDEEIAEKALSLLEECLEAGRKSSPSPSTAQSE